LNWTPRTQATEREREGERAVPKQRWSWNARAGVSVEIARSEEIALSEEIAQSKAHSEKKAPKRAGKETGRRGGKWKKREKGNKMI
jgi:hypothetical protein